MARVSEPTGPGMGRPSGPDFAGPSLSGPALPPAGSPPAGPPPSASVPPTPPAPPPNRLPTVLTAVAIAMVGLVVVLASVWAGHQDAQPPAPEPTPSLPATASQLPANQIEFSTDTGSGVLEIVSHSWDPAGAAVGDQSRLTLEVTVRCRTGTLRYGPDSFEAFDQQGNLFEATYDPDSSTALELIRLSAGEQASGTVVFEIPRGEVTLLLNDEVSRTITALKVPD